MVNYFSLQLFSRNNHKNGFSLLELLVGIAILGIVSVIAVNLFLTSLKNKNKLEAQMMVKQNGNQALQLISTLIRNAKIVSCGGGGSTAVISGSDGGTTTFYCSSPTDCPSSVSSNRIASNSACLTNANFILSNCSFTCDISTSGKPTTVKVAFTLTKGLTSDIGNYTSQIFSTTISLRKY